MNVEIMFKEWTEELLQKKILHYNRKGKRGVENPAGRWKDEQTLPEDATGQ